MGFSRGHQGHRPHNDDNEEEDEDEVEYNDKDNNNRKFQCPNCSTSKNPVFLENKECPTVNTI